MRGPPSRWAERALAAAAGIILATLLTGCSQATAPDDSPPPAAVGLTFGPYVSDVGPRRAEVHWIAPAGVDNACRLLDGGAGAFVTVGTSAITGREDVRCTATITGLVPGTRYWYEVTSGGARAEGSFRTPPEVESEVNR